MLYRPEYRNINDVINEKWKSAIFLSSEDRWQLRESLFSNVVLQDMLCNITKCSKNWCQEQGKIQGQWELNCSTISTVFFCVKCSWKQRWYQWKPPGKIWGSENSSSDVEYDRTDTHGGIVSWSKPVVPKLFCTKDRLCRYRIEYHATIEGSLNFGKCKGIWLYSFFNEVN